jgi:hypothetical protein
MNQMISRFPSPQVKDSKPASQPNGSWYEVVDAEEIARRLKVKPSWVYDQVRSDAEDPMPHLRLGRWVRFQPDSPEFQAWLTRRKSGHLFPLSRSVR